LQSHHHSDINLVTCQVDNVERGTFNTEDPYLLPGSSQFRLTFMITPRFECSQTAESVIVSVYCPSIRVSYKELVLIA